MPNKHANPHLGWNPPADLEAWVRSEAQRRGVPYSALLNEVIATYRDLVNCPTCAGVYHLWQVKVDPVSGRCAFGHRNSHTNDPKEKPHEP